MHSQFFPNSGVLDVNEAEFQLSIIEIIPPLLVATVHSVVRPGAEKWRLWWDPAPFPGRALGALNTQALHNTRAEKGMISKFSKYGSVGSKAEGL